MWITSTLGFFSVVQKPGEADLTVRARAASDLDRLRERYLPSLSATVVGGGSDYPYRARATHLAVADAMRQMVADVDYSNFKSTVSKTSGHPRAKVYGRVWHELLALESLPGAAPKPGIDPRRSPSGREAAYGGLVLDDRGRVLLREPTNHFGGYVWTFAKGRPRADEQPDATALREVREETGVVADIVDALDGWFEGDTSDTRFFVMRVLDEPGDFDAKETASVRWVALDEAESLLQQTCSARGRARDLSVLAKLRAYVRTKSGGRD